jgi:protein-tyrosine phosphatase
VSSSIPPSSNAAIIHDALSRSSDADEQVPNPSLILTDLFLSSVLPPQNKSKLEEFNITHILNLTSLDKDGVPKHPNAFPSDFEYLHLPLNDTESFNIGDHFERAHDFISRGRTGNAKVLVHCQSGVSRSATIVISYLMKEKGNSLKEALDHVKLQKPDVAPNNEFFNTLIKFEKDLRGLDTHPSITLSEYMADMLLEGPAVGFSRCEVIEALENNDNNPYKALNSLYS